jgi:large subunit ribosomal protein L9
MKIILLKDIEKLGKKYEIKEVKEGYARNFLIPQGLAKQVTKEALRWLEIQKETEAKKIEEELKNVQELASSIDGYELTIPAKVSEGGQLYENINSQKIAERLQAENFMIDKKQIELEKPIKELGEFLVKIKFKHNLEAEIKVIIVEE